MMCHYPADGSAALTHKYNNIPWQILQGLFGKELLYAAQGIMNRTYEPMFPLFGVALMYLILVMIFTWLLGKLEGRLAKSDRR